MQNKFYEKMWFILLTLIMIPPLGIILMWKHKKFNGISRVIVSVIFGFWFFIFAAACIQIITQKDLSENVEVEEKLQTVSNEEIKKITTEISKEDEKSSDAVDLNGEIKIHFIDVGQADSILIQQGSESMLIDAGNNADEDVIKNYLDKQGITKLNYVIGTHAHEDHIGSLDYIINSFNVGNIYFPKQTATTKTFENFVNACSNKNLKFIEPKVGELFYVGKAECTILAPNGSLYEDANNYSIVIKLKFGNTSFLFTGDAEAVSESEMLSKGLDLHADLLKVAHHGSKSSTSVEFLSAVSPKYAVVSVGADNDYGHPNQQTMDRLKAVGIEVYRTDENGTIVAISDGNTISFSTSPGSYTGKSSVEDTNASAEFANNISTIQEGSNSNGTTTIEPAQGERTVYWTPNGKSYHYDRNCSTLARSKTVLEGKASECKKSDPCNICVK